MMTNIDRAGMNGGMAEGVDGGTGWLDAEAVERFCDELAETRLMVARASLRLAVQWPTGNGERNCNRVTDNGGHGDGQT